MIDASKCTQTYRQFYSTLFLSKRFVKDDQRPGTGYRWRLVIDQTVIPTGIPRPLALGMTTATWHQKPQSLGLGAIEMIKLFFGIRILALHLDLWILCALEAWMPVSLSNWGGKDVQRVNTAPTPAPLIGARRRSIEALLEKRRTSLKAAKMMKEMSSTTEVGVKLKMLTDPHWPPRYVLSSKRLGAGPGWERSSATTKTL